MSTNARVVMSERLGAIGDIERTIVTETGADLISAALWSEDELVRNGADADVLIVGASEPVTADVLAKLTGVRCIVRRGVGVDNVDVAAATREGIPVAYIPDASVEEVSDHALALLLGAERQLFAAHQHTAAGDLTAAGAAVSAGRRFADLTLGVVGLGRIGRALARKATSVFGSIVAYDPMVTLAPAGVRLQSLPELFAAADLISLHAPGTPDGRPILDAAAFAMCRPGVVVVNTARGRLIDESALLAALDAGRVRIAALDVTVAEPLPADSPLRGRSDVVLVGHTAAKGTRSSAALREGVAAATIRALRGQAPEHLADPSVLDSPLVRLTERT
jgi:D-3-phosphoglycerate dehydrogenase